MRVVSIAYFAVALAFAVSGQGLFYCSDGVLSASGECLCDAGRVCTGKDCRQGFVADGQPIQYYTRACDNCQCVAATSISCPDDSFLDTEFDCQCPVGWQCLGDSVQCRKLQGVADEAEDPPLIHFFNSGCENCYCLPDYAIEQPPETEPECEADEWYDRMAQRCLKITSCTAGQRILVEASVHRDRWCMDCLDGTYQPNTNQLDCLVVTTCSETEVQVVDATPTSDRKCACMAGYFRSPDSPQACVACADGSFKDAVGDGECDSWSACDAGMEVITVGSASADRELRACPNGTFKPLTGCDSVCESVSYCAPGVEIEAEAPTTTSDRLCDSVQPCDPHVAYRLSAPTATTDAVCAQLTECNPSQYQSTPNTPTSDRICSPLTECGEFQFEVAAPTAETDRVCQDLSTCATITLAPATPTSDRVCDDVNEGCNSTSYYNGMECVPYTICRADQYERVAPSSTSNRVCTAITYCGEGAYQTAPATWTSNTQCAAITPCADFVLLEASNYTDNVCGQYTQCGLDQWEAKEPTTSSDRFCIDQPPPCAETQVEIAEATLTTQRQCVPRSECELGVTYETSPGTATTDRVCSPVTPCAQHQFLAQAATLTEDNQCQRLTICRSYEFELVAPTNNADRVCLPYSHCPWASYATSLPTATTDRMCKHVTLCNPTSQYVAVYQTATSDAVCANVSVCTDAQYEQQAPTPTTDRACDLVQTCNPVTQYQTAAATKTSDTVCATLSTCNVATQYQQEPSTPTSDRVCSDVTSCDFPSFTQVPATPTSDAQCAPFDLDSFTTVTVIFPADFSTINQDKFKAAVLRTLRDEPLSVVGFVNVRLSSGSVVCHMDILDATAATRVSEAAKNGEFGVVVDGVSITAASTGTDGDEGSKLSGTKIIFIVIAIACTAVVLPMIVLAVVCSRSTTGKSADPDTELNDMAQSVIVARQRQQEEERSQLFGDPRAAFIERQRLAEQQMQDTSSEASTFRPESTVVGNHLSVSQQRLDQIGLESPQPSLRRKAPQSSARSTSSASYTSVSFGKTKQHLMPDGKAKGGSSQQDADDVDDWDEDSTLDRYRTPQFKNGDLAGLTAFDPAALAIEMATGRSSPRAKALDEPTPSLHC
eukprot:m.67972 g.67972  ORF g.67972 m.67972 type:complete len:1114 (-) comp12182_c0_seq1:380-3721(-)